MRKKLIFMLLIAFTFQFCWTAASAFCQHEADKTAQHFGHHPHQHQSTETDKNADNDHDGSKKPTSAKKVTSHPDCATCSHGGSLATELQVSPLDILNRQYVDSLTQLQPATPFQAEPERPKWMTAV